MFNWLKNFNKQVENINSSVNDYKNETNNQVIPTLAYINRAKKHIETGNFQEAKKLITEALNLNPKDALSHKYLGVCQENIGEIDNAINSYTISAHINPQDKDIWHKLALLQISIHKYKEAELSCEKANRAAPLNTDIQTAWGMSLFKQGKYKDALEKFTNAIKINRYNFSALLLSAITEIRLNKYDDAEKKLLFLISANPNEGCLYEYANLCFIKNNYDMAISYAQKSLLINDKMLPAYILIGKCFSYKFDYENCIKYFKQAEDKELINSILYTEWGNSLLNLYKFSEAKAIYEKALEQDIENTDANLGLALCMCENNENNDKVQEIIKNTKKHENVICYEIKGMTEYNSENYKKAVEYFKKALIFDNKNLYDYLRLVKCYKKLNNSEMIKDSYEKFIKFNPNFIDSYIDYAEYLITIKEYKDAQRKLRKATNLDGNNQQALNMLFYTNYILVKENICEYNIKETISLANQIEEFEYPELKQELELLLGKTK